MRCLSIQESCLQLIITECSKAVLYQIARAEKLTVKSTDRKPKIACVVLAEALERLKDGVVSGKTCVSECCMHVFSHFLIFFFVLNVRTVCCRGACSGRQEQQGQQGREGQEGVENDGFQACQYNSSARL